MVSKKSDWLTSQVITHMARDWSDTTMFGRNCTRSLRTVIPAWIKRTEAYHYSEEHILMFNIWTNRYKSDMSTLFSISIWSMWNPQRRFLWIYIAKRGIPWWTIGAAAAESPSGQLEVGPVGGPVGSSSSRWFDQNQFWCPETKHGNISMSISETAIAGTYQIERLFKRIISKKCPSNDDLIWYNTIQYLHFGILKFPLNIRNAYTSQQMGVSCIGNTVFGMFGVVICRKSYRAGQSTTNTSYPEVS